MQEHPLQLALCMVHYTALQCSTGNLRFALCMVRYTVLQCSTGDLQCSLCKLHDRLFQCNKVIFNVHCASYTTNYCTASLVICSLHYAQHIHKILQCNICDMQFTVQFTLYGTAVMQCCNIMAFEQNRCTSLFLFLSRRKVICSISVV
jgi:hypothetical protein